MSTAGGPDADETLRIASQWLAEEQTKPDDDDVKFSAPAPLAPFERPLTPEEASMSMANNLFLGGLTGGIFGAFRSYQKLKLRAPPVANRNERAAVRTGTVRGAKTSAKPEGLSSVLIRNRSVVAHNARHYGLRFSLAMGIFTMVEVGSGMARGKRDIWGRSLAGAVTGGVLGTMMISPAAGLGYGGLMGMVALWTHQLVNLASQANQGKLHQIELLKRDMEEDVEEEQANIAADPNYTPKLLKEMPTLGSSKNSYKRET